jgi:spermidine synthase
MLTINVALPFVFLAATGPLVQAWFARAFPARSPYALYALSNLGSLAALVLYPIAFEPLLSLTQSGRIFSLGFGIVGPLVLVCGLVAAREPHGLTVSRSTAAIAEQPAPGRATIAMWVLLAACAVVLLNSITSKLCLDIASVPFLWLLPLALYLISLIVCFGMPAAYHRWLFAMLGLAAAMVILMRPVSSLMPNALEIIFAGRLGFTILIYGVLLFATCMSLHGELVRLRPPTGSLTLYYLCISGGGALGGSLSGLVAPRVFSDYYELPLGVILWWVLFLVAMKLDRDPAASGRTLGLHSRAFAGVSTALVVFAGAQSLRDLPDVKHRERTFFGVLRVIEKGSKKSNDLHTVLMNGTTIHGYQTKRSPRRPTSYYGVAGGIGIALRMRPPEDDTRVGVVGLGIGTLAAYGRSGDRFRFYEIDPGVIRLARDLRYFSFLVDTEAEIEVVEGDARIAIAEEVARGDEKLDVLVVDAFSSDAIPVHLLTNEAIALYRKRLGEGGLIAIHVSNRHFDLTPIAFRIAREQKLAGLSVRNDLNLALDTTVSQWVFLSADSGRIDRLENAVQQDRSMLRLDESALATERPDPDAILTTPLWTDDYSNLIGVLNW